MKGCSEFGAGGLYGRKVGKLPRKNIQKTARQKGNKQAPGCGGARELRRALGVKEIPQKLMQENMEVAASATA
jgi:hypothetical protein